MVWPPAHFIRPVVGVTAPRAIDPDEHSVQVRGYLREYFEAVIRYRAQDPRLRRQSGAAELLALYDPMSTEDVMKNLRSLNHSLEAEDRARFPPETYGTEEAWQPLALTQRFADTAADAAVYADLVVTHSGSLAELSACRAVVEAMIAVWCQDARRDYLRGSERATLLRLAGYGNELLIAAYTRANNTIERLGLDQRIQFDPLSDGNDGLAS